MKKIGFLSLFLLSIISFGQEQLKVVYEIQPFYEPLKTDKSNMEMTFLDSTYELILDKNESEYNYIEKIRNDQKTHEPGMISAAFEMSAQGVLYKNLKDGYWLAEVKVENKPYLLRDQLPKIDWKISKETKNIAGFDCYKATAILDDKYKTAVTAWYSPKLAFRNGPDEYWGLPGLILGVETLIKHNSGSTEGTTYTTQKVEILTKTKKINRPTKGTEISEEAFIEMQNAHFEKMMEMDKGGVDKD